MGLFVCTTYGISAWTLQRILLLLLHYHGSRAPCDVSTAEHFSQFSIKAYFVQSKGNLFIKNHINSRLTRLSLQNQKVRRKNAALCNRAALLEIHYMAGVALSQQNRLRESDVVCSSRQESCQRASPSSIWQPNIVTISNWHRAS